MLIKMDWTSLYLKTANLNVFILGTGEVATRRANKFLDHGANVKLAGDVLDKELINKGAVLASVDDVVNLVQWSDVVVIASGDRELSDYVSKIAEDKLLNRADFPDNGNIIVPTRMARQLRKKIQSIITEEDILEIELQDYSRKLLKSRISDQKKRRQYLYEIFNDENIKGLLDNHKIDEAKEYIDDLIRGFDDT